MATNEAQADTHEYSYRDTVEITDPLYSGGGAYRFARVEGSHIYPTGGTGRHALQEVLMLRKLDLADHYQHSGEIEYKPTTVIIHMVPAWCVKRAEVQERSGA